MRTTVRDAHYAIRNRQPFTASSLSGEAHTPGNVVSRGLMPDIYARIKGFELEQADYIVTSYWTPIAWHTSNGWVRPKVSYSNTTAKHQGQCPADFTPDYAAALGIDRDSMSKAQAEVAVAAKVNGWKVDKGMYHWILKHKGRNSVVVYWTQAGSIREADITRSNAPLAARGSKDKLTAVENELYRKAV